MYKMKRSRFRTNEMCTFGGFSAMGVDTERTKPLTRDGPFSSFRAIGSRTWG